MRHRVTLVPAAATSVKMRHTAGVRRCVAAKCCAMKVVIGGSARKLWRRPGVNKESFNGRQSEKLMKNVAAENGAEKSMAKIFRLKKWRKSGEICGGYNSKMACLEKQCNGISGVAMTAYLVAAIFCWRIRNGEKRRGRRESGAAVAAQSIPGGVA